MGLSEKQDRTYTRTASDLEQKLGFGKKFSEVLGLIDDSRKYAESVESSLRSEIVEQTTSIARDTEKIIMTALESYVETSDYETFRQTVESEFKVMADRITMTFDQTTERIEEVDGEIKTMGEDLTKHFDFSVDGLVIKAGENAMQLVIDNDIIRFVKNGQEFGWWDGVDFHTGNIVVEVNERAQFGNFAFVPRSNGSLSFMKVGG